MATPHHSTGALIPDLVIGGISLFSIVLAAVGTAVENLQITAYCVSICAGSAAIVFGYLNYKLNRRKAGFSKRKFSKKSRK